MREGRKVKSGSQGAVENGSQGGAEWVAGAELRPDAELQRWEEQHSIRISWIIKKRIKIRSLSKGSTF